MRPRACLPLLSALGVLAVGAPGLAQTAPPSPTGDSVEEQRSVEGGAAGGGASSQDDDVAEDDDRRPVFLEPTIGVRFVAASLNGYLGLFGSHSPTEGSDNLVLPVGDLGVTVHVPLFHWLEVGGGVRVLYGSWDAEPWLPVELESVGVELAGQVRINLWFMDHWATHVPGSGGMDGGVFVELGLGMQVPIMLLRGEADADAIFLLRPMGGMIFRFGAGFHWMSAVGFAAAFAQDGWDGNDGPSLQGIFWITGVGVDLR